MSDESSTQTQPGATAAASLAGWAKGLDLTGKVGLLLGFVATFVLNDKGGLLFLGVLFFLLLKSASEWCLAFSHPPASRERRRALIIATTLTVPMVAVLLLLFLEVTGLLKAFL